VSYRLKNTPARFSPLTTAVIVAAAFLAPQAVLSQPTSAPQSTSRSFLFLWPGQNEQARQLSLTAPIVTDRASFTDSSRTVGAGVTQIELGYSYSYNGSDAQHQGSHTYPELSLRQGIFQDWLEFRLYQNLTTSDSPGSAYTGFDDLETGLRFGVTPQSGLLPELSITPHLRFPTGAAELRAHQVLFGIVASYSWLISDATSIAGSTQGVQEETAQEHDTYGEWTQSVIGTITLTSELSLWAECFAVFPAARSLLKDSYYVNSGINYLVTSNMQLDLRVGSRMQDGFGEDIFTGIGFSVRYL
jgi:hypothetical protein